MGKEIGKANPGRKRVRFAKEFKLEAVKLLEAGKKPAAQLALELGIRRNRLYKWQAQLSAKGAAAAFRGPGTDEPLQRVAGTVGTSFMQDGLGSVVASIPHNDVNNGTSAAFQMFDAWGNRTQGSGSVPNYGYTGREPDATGLVYYRARYYDPSIQRFTQRDPIGVAGGVNAYAYVGNSPVMLVDPLGQTPAHAASWLTGAVAGGIAGGIAGYNNSGGSYLGAAKGFLAGGVAGGVLGFYLQPWAAGKAGAAAGAAVTAAATTVAGTVVVNAIDKKPLLTNVTPGVIAGAALGGAIGSKAGHAFGRWWGGGEASKVVASTKNVKLEIAATAASAKRSAEIAAGVVEGAITAAGELAGHWLEDQIADDVGSLIQSITTPNQEAVRQGSTTGLNAGNQSVGGMMANPEPSYSGNPSGTVNTGK